MAVSSASFASNGPPAGPYPPQRHTQSGQRLYVMAATAATAAASVASGYNLAQRGNQVLAFLLHYTASSY